MNKRTGISVHGMVDLSHVTSSEPHDMAVWHYHSGYEIYFQLGGSRYMFYDNQRYLLKRGAVAIFKPYELHYGESADLGCYERYVVNFSEEYIGKVLGKTDDAKDILSRIGSGIFCLSESQTVFLSVLFGELIKEREKKIACDDMIFGCELIAMLSFLAGCEMEDDENGKKFESKIFKLPIVDNPISNSCNVQKDKNYGNASKIPGELIAAIEYINANYCAKISLDEVASVINIDKFYFSHLFKRYTGVTVMQYVSSVRISNANRLLNTTDMSVEQIAYASGFGSYTNMERAFKKKYGMTPIQLKKADKEQYKQKK